MAKGRGSGKTPQRVVELLSKAVAEKNQSAVSRDTGLTLFTVQRCLKGIGEPTTATLEKLSNYFGVAVWYLRGEDARVEDIEKEIKDTVTTLNIALGANGIYPGGDIIDAYNRIMDKFVDRYIDDSEFIELKSLLDERIRLLERKRGQV